jgi:hypothetical protein
MAGTEGDTLRLVKTEGGSRQNQITPGHATGVRTAFAKEVFRGIRSFRHHAKFSDQVRPRPYSQIQACVVLGSRMQPGTAQAQPGPALPC